MGCWGMGMAQTDEFCEIYDKFMEEYDNGKPVSEITAAVLAEYHAEFDDEDGIMHDVYFALAKAEWMCCEQSELVLNRVKEIIESGANIEFYRELEASESNLKVRQRNLEKFLKMLLVPREKPRKRKRSAPAPEKAFPPMEVGDCFAYKFDSGYRVICILERFKPQAEKEQVTVVIFNGVYSADELKTTDFRQEVMGKMFTVTAEDFLGSSVIKKIAHITVNPKNRERLLGVSAFMYGGKSSFRSEIKESLYVTLNEFLYHCEENSQELIDVLEVGGCYAFAANGGYKIVIVLDRFDCNGTEHVLVTVLARTFYAPGVDYMSEGVSHIGIYSAETLPNIDGWSLNGRIELPSSIKDHIHKYNVVTTENVLKFFAAPPYYSGVLTLSSFLQVYFPDKQ